MFRTLTAASMLALACAMPLQEAAAQDPIAGGILVPLVLNSRSTHVLSGMGGLEGRALRAGDRVPVPEKGSAAFFAQRA